MKNKISINTQSSIRINDQKIIYFDPFKIEKESHDADLIFITHDHYDHLDMDSINKIKKDDTIMVIPDSIKDKVNFKNLITVSPNNTYNILGYQVLTIPSYNLNKNFHKKEFNYVGYLITINNEKIYISGDTDITKENQEVKCDIALVPIGGTYTMDYHEASSLINKIKPKTVIPTHYGSIVGTLDDGLKFKNLLDKEIECLLLIK